MELPGQRDSPGRGNSKREGGVEKVSLWAPGRQRRPVRLKWKKGRAASNMGSQVLGSSDGHLNYKRIFKNLGKC